MSSYSKEFPDFGALDVALPEGFRDVSWHNDACPSFELKLPSVGYLKLWVDYVNLDDRELGFDRFTLSLLDQDQEYQSDLLNCEQWADMVAFIADYRAKAEA